MAQYILLLLTDYATKGFYNPEDERFAVEIGRQGIKEEKNISLYAVSKAMGFIPRHKLGHAFFRCVAVYSPFFFAVRRVLLFCVVRGRFVRATHRFDRCVKQNGRAARKLSAGQRQRGAEVSFCSAASTWSNGPFPVVHKRALDDPHLMPTGRLD